MEETTDYVAPEPSPHSADAPAQVPRQTSEAWPRPPYTLTNKPRPIWRGRMMGSLHKTRAWYLIALGYVLLAAKMSASRLGPINFSMRVAAAIATCANIFISDGYHNGDKRGARRGSEAYDPDVETVWLRWDYIGISAILTTQYWLWASNFGWVKLLALGGWLSGAALAAVMAISRFVVPKKAGHTAVKVVMAFQFVALLGYLVFMGMLSGPLACRLNGLIFAFYSPGLVCYVLKKPQHPVFGFHEIFHTSVLAGHSVSMLFDLINVRLPCAGCASLAL